MKQIELAPGLFTTVDDSDYAFLSQWKWSASYSGRMRKCVRVVRQELRSECVGRKPKTLLMHRVITGAGDGLVVDHRDRNGLNNCKDNLRVCSHAENSLNMAAHTDSVGSHFKGVSRHRRGKFAARFRGDYLGLFPTEALAAAAYDRAAGTHNREFALTNRVLEEV